ncbi:MULTISPECIES: hypothetical protein [unclassified Cytobacillus]|uniref:hypothetical protein n=1 Tax=unclassified Cytobacillus TaxID=2675268 RepID=UPI0020409828|nr:hypothetical protein [Cytobacillus sp. AMY 15.2]MCM3089994.1 hypothetical protein [Cytobacillus sp. AMY 15.2]
MTTKRQGHIQKRAPWRLYDDEKAMTHAKTGAMGLYDYEKAVTHAKTGAIEPLWLP